MSKNLPFQRTIKISILFMSVVVLGSSVYAQSAAVIRPFDASEKISTTQKAAVALNNLPEGDSLLYLSPRRILTEAVPRVLPEKDLENMRAALNNLKAQVGFDPRTVDYVVLEVRFKKPAADLSFSLPEFMMVASGDFDGAALLQVLKQASQGKLREETYNSTTLNIMPIEEMAKQAEKTPLLKSLSEVAIALLNGNTLAAGTTSYVKAAVDAAQGHNRISPELVNSALRDPSALVSTAGSPLTAFAKTFALLGTENNPRAPKCDMKLGDYYASITMDEKSFKVRGAMNADNPDTAKIIKSLVTMGIEAAVSNIKDSQAQSALRGLVITPTDTEVLIQADISQQAVADFVRDVMAPKKQEASPATATIPESKTKPKRRAKRGAVKKPH